MATANEIELAGGQPVQSKKRNSLRDSSLILGIVLITVFLGLFVLEFSRILVLAGTVDHTPPTKAAPPHPTAQKTL